VNSKAASRLLQLMLEDLPNQDDIYQPTSFWAEASKPIVADLQTHGFERFRSLPSALAYFVPTYGPPGNTLTAEEVQNLEDKFLESNQRRSKKHSTLMHLLDGEMWALGDYRVAKAGDRQHEPPGLTSVSESKVGHPAEHFCFEDRWFSRSFLNYLHGLVFLKQNVDSGKVRRVIEIGGGFGTLGEILHQVGDCAYVDVDIPPTAAVASYYLANQPGARVNSYSETRSLKTIPFPETGTQMVICPWQLPRLEGRADLLVNFISFQEMEPHVVQNYLDHAIRLGCRYVLLRNLREGKGMKTDQRAVGVKTPLLGQDYDRFLPGYRLLGTNVFPFGYRTIDGFHSELRLYARSD